MEHESIESLFNKISDMLTEISLRMSFCLFFFQLEDDIIAKSDYYRSMKSFIAQKASQEWLYLEFSYLGFIGMALKVHEK